MSILHQSLITHTRRWVEEVIVACNFCPFAAKVVAQEAIRYVVLPKSTWEDALEAVYEECCYLDEHPEAETTLVIFAEQFQDFEQYLDFLAMAEDLLAAHFYEGVYQLASFHPDYCFEGSDADDPANYTNRSPYPMLHLLREESVEKALEHFPDPEQIPERNVLFARQKGLAYMQALREGAIRQQ